MRAAALHVPEAADASHLRSHATAQSELVEAIARHAPSDGRHPSPWADLSFFRASEPTRRSPVVYEPCVFIVGQGSKRVYVGAASYTYDPLNYLVLAMPLPAEAQVLEASREQPFLSLCLRIDLAELSELLLAIGDAPERREPARCGVYASALQAPLAGAVQRLVATLVDPVALRVLAPLAAREVLFHLLRGTQGETLRAVARRNSQARRIAGALRFVREHYAEPLDVAAIARVAAMSPSTLHHTFKEVTSASPLQYLKQIRLHQARRLMLQDGLGAAEAAYRVGYGSPSQFSREFRRLFGEPPAQEARRLRALGSDGEAA